MTVNQRVFAGLSLIAVLAAFVLAAANLYLGDLNQDEGWYLYAARLTASGQLPFADFAFTQGPVMPLVYALFEPVVAVWGLAGGRLITALLGLAAAGLAALLAFRLAGAELRAGAALATFILIGVNVYQSYFCTVVKTYSLTALLLVLGFLALAEGWTRRRAWLICAAGALMTLAAGTRSSAGVVLPIVLLFLLVARNAPQAARNAPSPAWLYFGLGAVVMAGLVFLPFLIAAPESFLYFVVKYHTLRFSGGGLMTLVYKAGFLSRLIQAYFVVLGIGIAVVLARWTMARAPVPGAGPAPAIAPALMRMLWGSIIAVTLVHFAAPFPYDDYQVFVFPLLAIAVVNAAMRFAGPRGGAWFLISVLVLSLAAAGSSPLNQDWFIQGRDRIWWLVKDRSPLRKLRATAAQIRSGTQPGDLLLTQDPYIAVEAGREIPRGLEMGQFSYFPELSDGQADRLHVFNRAGFERLLRTTEAPVAALSGYALAIQSPAITPISRADRELFAQIVAERYTLATNVPAFGQAGTTLVIYRKKPGM